MFKSWEVFGGAPAGFDGQLKKVLQNTRIQYSWNGTKTSVSDCDQADSLVQIVIPRHTENPWIFFNTHKIYSWLIKTWSNILRLEKFSNKKSPRILLHAAIDLFDLDGVPPWSGARHWIIQAIQTQHLWLRMSVSVSWAKGFSRGYFGWISKFWRFHDIPVIDGQFHGENDDQPSTTWCFEDPNSRGPSETGIPTKWESLYSSMAACVTLFWQSMLLSPDSCL